jgi:RNA polymerase-binding transcription factor DksA
MIDTAKYKTMLETDLEGLTAELKDIGIHDPKNTENWIERANDLEADSADPNDVADRTEEWDERRATVAVLEARYNNVTRALEKMENGTYGTCEVGGEEIEEDRLDANPAARTCKKHLEEESSLAQ